MLCQAVLSCPPPFNFLTICHNDDVIEGQCCQVQGQLNRHGPAGSKLPEVHTPVKPGRQRRHGLGRVEALQLVDSNNLRQLGLDGSQQAGCAATWGCSHLSHGRLLTVLLLLGLHAVRLLLLHLWLLLLLRWWRHLC
jgi:hypothetical protein